MCVTRCSASAVTKGKAAVEDILLTSDPSFDLYAPGVADRYNRSGADFCALVISRSGRAGNKGTREWNWWVVVLENPGISFGNTGISWRSESPDPPSSTMPDQNGLVTRPYWSASASGTWVPDATPVSITRQFRKWQVHGWQVRESEVCEWVLNITSISPDV